MWNPEISTNWIYIFLWGPIKLNVQCRSLWELRELILDFFQIQIKWSSGFLSSSPTLQPLHLSSLHTWSPLFPVCTTPRHTAVWQAEVPYTFIKPPFFIPFPLPPTYTRTPTILDHTRHTAMWHVEVPHITASLDVRGKFSQGSSLPFTSAPITPAKKGLKLISDSAQWSVACTIIIAFTIVII